MEILIDSRISFDNCSIEDTQGTIVVQINNVKHYVSWDSINKTSIQALTEAKKLLIDK